MYTLSLHDALPIWSARHVRDGDLRPGRLKRFDGKLRLGNDRAPFDAQNFSARRVLVRELVQNAPRGKILSVEGDRKSTRLNSSHPSISYAAFSSKKKTTQSPSQAAFVTSPTMRNTCAMGWGWSPWGSRHVTLRRRSPPSSAAQPVGASIVVVGAS